MKELGRNIPPLAIASLLLLTHCGSGRVDAVEFSPGGFDAAYFDVEDLRAVANDDEVYWFHFYNALGPKSTNGTVIAMGAYKDHEELYSWYGPWYRRFIALADDGANCAKVIQSDALDQIRDLRDAGGEPFAAMFMVDEVWTMIQDARAEGVRLTPRRTDDDKNWTMLMEPVTFDRGTATVISGYSLTCTTPCPEFCGDPATYFLNMRL